MRGSKIAQILVASILVIACSKSSENEDETEVGSDDQVSGESALGASGGTSTCVKRNDDCSFSKGCCTGSVCAFGGEREGTWCQALEPAAWTRSCVQARIGSKVRTSASSRGRVCLTLDGETMASTCYEVKNGYCLIGFNGECGSGEYFIHTSSLVQVDPRTVPDEGAVARAEVRLGSRRHERATRTRRGHRPRRDRATRSIRQGE